MVKSKDIAIEEFNQLVNMDAGELSEWLKEGASISSGWRKNGEDSGETVGHESGRQIVKILENNPRRDPERYTGRDIEHMRRVVAYCKRHLAQQEMAKQNTGSKSYRSLKN